MLGIKPVSREPFLQSPLHYLLKVNCSCQYLLTLYSLHFQPDKTLMLIKVALGSSLKLLEAKLRFKHSFHYFTICNVVCLNLISLKCSVYLFTYYLLILVRHAFIMQIMPSRKYFILILGCRRDRLVWQMRFIFDTCFGGRLLKQSHYVALVGLELC